MTCLRVLLLLSFGLAIGPASGSGGRLLAQTPISASTTLASAGLQQDVAILRSTFEQLHPGLYRYLTRAQSDQAFDQLNRDFATDQTLQQVFLHLSAFTARIRCGHTYPNFFNQSEALQAALFERTDKVPFFFRWIGTGTGTHRMIVTRDLTQDHSLPPGTEILAINGTPAPVILQRLLPLVRGDGANDIKRIDLLQVRGEAAWDAFDVYFPMLFPQTTPTLHLKIKKPQQTRTTTLDTPALSFAQRKASLATASSNNASDRPLFTLTYLPSGAARLTMPTWSVYNSTWDWKSWLNSALNQIVAKQAPALILDLRGNEGGEDCGDLILARLSHQPAPATDYARLVRYRAVPADLLPNLSTWDPSFKNWGDKAVALPAPWPTAPPVPYLRQLADTDQAQPAASHPAQPALYTGQVFVLTDAANSSATFNFSRTIQLQRLGKLVGEATGGNQRGINGGAFFFLKLPHSAIEIDLPLIGYFPPTPQPDAGLTPDIPVHPGQSDIASSSDPTLKTVEALLTHKPAPPSPSRPAR